MGKFEIFKDGRLVASGHDWNLARQAWRNLVLEVEKELETGAPRPVLRFCTIGVEVTYLPTLQDTRLGAVLAWPLAQVQSRLPKDCWHYPAHSVDLTVWWDGRPLPWAQEETVAETVGEGPAAPSVEQHPCAEPLDMHAPGAKDDADKVRAELVLGGFARALLEVAKVATYGARKYTPGGWQFVPDAWTRYTGAMDRHRLAEGAQGEPLGEDPETGIPHAAHTAWNALARLELALREREADTDS